MTATNGAHCVTGAFGYSGKYIAQRLLDAGQEVRTLTNSLRRPHAFGDRVAARPLAFGDPTRLAESLRGVRVLYNTYWVRFNHRTFQHSVAVDNTQKLFAAAKAAGVERVVHVSITNPSADSPLEYFSGKAVLEDALRASGMSYAILRPAVLFGREDILINNIAWLLRRFAVFGVFGDGEYRLQPIFVDDLARLAVEHARTSENVVIDAIGPETFTFREFAETLGRIIGKPRRVISIPPWIGLWGGRVLGVFVRDVLITREEIEGLMSDLLCTDSVPTGATRFTDWAAENAERLGARYASELGRRRDRERAYQEI